MGTCPYKHGDGSESQGLTTTSKGGPMGIIGNLGFQGTNNNAGADKKPCHFQF